ncbi:alpha/beta fold hydrolase [Nocardia flavorosea]|uniref:esterase/lipase family protein n=1 Tax=Nocardia flavorosea TaxID=53429 RepID=UPI00189454CF|nr:alpha/beta fold hydrolase [Nocardia flavorosea]MBF6349707.1 alpha/beta fold hydrolase [Nocardia flavorosea]
MRKLLAVVGAVVTGLAVAAGAGPAAADELPVEFNFFAGIGPELANPGGSLPGSNDYGCVPSPTHPDPVVLVHGTGGSQQTNWGAYVPLLKNAGYCVFSITYGAPAGLPWPVTAVGGMGEITESARQLGVFVDGVLAATGASEVDIVGHSQGTVMPAYYAKYLGGRDKIDKYVSLAPAWNGTTVAGADVISETARRLGVQPENFPICHACLQLDPGSAFMQAIRAGGHYLPEIEYTNIATQYDELIVPYTSGLQPGGSNVRNIVVQEGCPVDYTEHAGIAGSRRAAYFVLNALDPEHRQPVPCDRAAPFSGAPF